MKEIAEVWNCTLGCGKFTTKSDLVKCPKCKTRKVKFWHDAISEQSVQEN